VPLSHFHLRYFEREGAGNTNYSASFFSEIEAVQAAGLANSGRGAETGYYGIQKCRRHACRPEFPDEEIRDRVRRPGRVRGLHPLRQC
jgi:hypothetical protein